MMDRVLINGVAALIDVVLRNVVRRGRLRRRNSQL